MLRCWQQWALKDVADQGNGFSFYLPQVKRRASPFGAPVAGGGRAMGSCFFPIVRFSVRFG
jgi:hypothetical protein